MNDSILRFLGPDPVWGIAGVLLGFLLYIVAVSLPILAGLYVVYFLLTLPMRRAERSRLFLDLLEVGLREGATAEGAISDAASSRDAALGARFHLLAFHLRGGLRLGAALERVPGLLAPELVAMLKTGERIGDMAKVLPAGRLLLKDTISQVRGALNYLLPLFLITLPATIGLPLIIQYKILPVFNRLFADTEIGGLPPFTKWVFSTTPLAAGIQAGLLLLVWLAALAYLGGPRLKAWARRVLPGGELLLDWLSLRLPWRRKRLQRDFSAMLAILLEAEIPEAEAVRLAAEATANIIIARRAEEVRVLLQQGKTLPDALRSVDDSGELHWRISNALRRAGGFVRALAGWHEALDAKAFQLEQTAAQVATTTLVLVNGALAAGMVIAIFLALIQAINQATLW